LLRRVRDRHEGFTEFSIRPGDDLAKSISEGVWTSMQDYCNFLKPLNEATVLMSASEYPTLGLIVPVFHLIMKHVKESIVAKDGFRSTHTVTFAAAVEEKLDGYKETVLSQEVLIAAGLDPRVKNLLSLCGVDETEVQIAIERDWILNYQDKYSSAKNPCASGRERSQDGDQGSFLGALLSQRPQVTEELFTNELCRWGSHSSMDIKQSSREVCLWLKVNSALFPRVSIMSRDYLGVTSTSVPSECAFSRAGTTVGIRRACLGDDAVQAISELQSFLAFNKI
jgi:hypothetical protein